MQHLMRRLPENLRQQIAEFLSVTCDECACAPTHTCALCKSCTCESCLSQCSKCHSHLCESCTVRRQCVVCEGIFCAKCLLCLLCSHCDEPVCFDCSRSNSEDVTCETCMTIFRWEELANSGGQDFD